MSLDNYHVADLWKRFMPKRHLIIDKITDDLISMAIYPDNYFKEIQSADEFEKWAAVEVSEFEKVPQGMERFELPRGLYAIFDYKGSSADNSIYNYIYRQWLPVSCFDLDNRPHFEILGPKYRNGSPDSEEEIWIPICYK